LCLGLAIAGYSPAMASELLQSLLTECGLAEKAVPVDERFVRLQYGSAFVLLGISGTAVVAVAPLFRQLPAQNTEAFYRKLLTNNAQMGGMASFAIQEDGWVVLHAGRSIKGLDSGELAVLVSGVGRFADQFDDQLIAEFYAPPSATSAPGWDDEVGDGEVPALGGTAAVADPTAERDAGAGAKPASSAPSPPSPAAPSGEPTGEPV
jgi:Tir chaperone protein (CesT) family